MIAPSHETGERSGSAHSNIATELPPVSQITIGPMTSSSTVSGYDPDKLRPSPILERGFEDASVQPEIHTTEGISSIFPLPCKVGM